MKIIEILEARYSEPVDEEKVEAWVNEFGKPFLEEAGYTLVRFGWVLTGSGTLNTGVLIIEIDSLEKWEAIAEDPKTDEWAEKWRRQFPEAELKRTFLTVFQQERKGGRGESSDPHSSWFVARARFGRKTAIAYVSAVRFVDGEVWKADTKKVIETAGDMPELSFLSRIEMLEIEKEQKTIKNYADSQEERH